MRLHTYVDARAWLVTEAPRDFRGRAWLLGVVAVQVSVVGERLDARVRAHLTGAGAPSVRALGSSSRVEVAYGDEAPRTDALTSSLALPPPALPPGAWAQLSLFSRNQWVAAATLPRGATDGTRAFGHVFCRFLRDGGVEPGFDLTDFLALPPGAKYERLVQRALAPGDTVGYALTLAT